MAFFRYMTAKCFFAALIACVGLLFQAYAGEAPESVPETPASDIPPVLEAAAAEVQDALNKLDSALADAALKLSGTGLTNTEARAVLSGLHASHTGLVVDVCAVSPLGIIVAVEPAAFGSAQGADIRGQEHVQGLLETRRPVMSRVFQNVEGFDAACIAHPVFGSNNVFLGSISIAFKPASLIGDCVAGLVEDKPLEIFAMQPDGLALYDADSAEIGRMLFSDTAYQPFTAYLQFAHQMMKQPKGTGAYSFFKDGTMVPVDKNASWTTVSLHGMEWRLSVAYIDMAKVEAALTYSPPPKKPLNENILRGLCHNIVLLRALMVDDEPAVRAFLEKVFARYSDVYSLAWIDPAGVSRFGYPPENSLAGVDLRTLENSTSKQFTTLRDTRRVVSFEDKLVEGGQARFCMSPLLRGTNFFGALLWISKPSEAEQAQPEPPAKAPDK